MTEVQKTIKEIEDGLKTILDKACLLPAEIVGYKPQQAILSFKKSLRGLMGIELGELKNNFGIGIKQELEKDSATEGIPGAQANNQ